MENTLRFPEIHQVRHCIYLITVGNMRKRIERFRLTALTILYDVISIEKAFCTAQPFIPMAPCSLTFHISLGVYTLWYDYIRTIKVSPNVRLGKNISSCRT